MQGHLFNTGIQEISLSLICASMSVGLGKFAGQTAASTIPQQTSGMVVSVSWQRVLR